jgi:toxin FitB
MYVLDTNVVSELRRPKPHGAVLAWLSDTAESSLFLSAVTLGEIQRGIELTREQDAVKAQDLSRWATKLMRTHQILPMDGLCFQTYATLMHRRSNTLNEDAMIAATALVNGMTVVTRNTKDFAVFDVPLFNPFNCA